MCPILKLTLQMLIFHRIVKTKKLLSGALRIILKYFELRVIRSEFSSNKKYPLTLNMLKGIMSIIMHN